MKNKRSTFLLLFVFAASPIFNASANAKDLPYYGFFPSEKGSEFKKLVHNILGFSIEIPANWTFGVNGAPPFAVVFVFPDGLDTSKISEGYESIEIGRLPIEGGSLEDAQKAVMLGMATKHPKHEILEPAKRVTLGGRAAIAWCYQWPSKTGFTVTEQITLVETTSGIRSLNVRTTAPDRTKRSKFFKATLETFSAFAPKVSLPEKRE